MMTPSGTGSLASLEAGPEVVVQSPVRTGARRDRRGREHRVGDDVVRAPASGCPAADPVRARRRSREGHRRRGLRLRHVRPAAHHRSENRPGETRSPGRRSTPRLARPLEVMLYVRRRRNADPGPADYLVATPVADSCYHAATTLSRSMVIYRHHCSVAILRITTG